MSRVRGLTLYVCPSEVTSILNSQQISVQERQKVCVHEQYSIITDSDDVFRGLCLDIIDAD